MGKALQNLAIFKLGWVACVFFAATGRPALATLAVAVVVLLHLLRVALPVKEALLLLAAALMGLAWETFMVFSGLIVYPEAVSGGGWAPYWIVAMWVLFATTINHGFRWIKRSGLMASLMGLLGGPLAFLGGVSMGAAQFSHTPLALAVIGLGWSLLLPLLCLVSDTITDSPFLEPQTRTATPRPVAGLMSAIGGVGRDV